MSVIGCFWASPTAPTELSCHHAPWGRDSGLFYLFVCCILYVCLIIFFFSQTILMSLFHTLRFLFLVGEQSSSLALAAMLY